MTELAAIRLGNTLPPLRTQYTESQALAIYAALARSLFLVGANDPVERDLILHALEIMGVDITQRIDVPVLLERRGAAGTPEGA